MDWLGQAEYIKTQNEAANRAVKEAVSFFELNGFVCKVLKGQGLAKLYPQPNLRTSGDIDLLLGDCYPSDNYIRSVVQLAKTNHSDHIHATYHHCDYGKVDGVEVEAHWRASWFYSPVYNKRFQRFCNEHIHDSDGIYPSLAFNRVYVLVHIYRHLFSEGIGLRQLLDYYVVLKSSAEDTFWHQQKVETMQRLRELGMERFTAPVMWILVEALGLKSECLLCKPNEKDGRKLMVEVMTAGNFGHADKRTLRREGEWYVAFKTRRIIRNFQHFRFGPWEMICAPWWRLWHLYWWMIRHRSPELPMHS